MNTFKELYLANWREFARDRTALFFTVAFPVIFILLFGFIFSSGGGVSADIGLAVQDNGPIGEQLAKQFEALPDTPAANPDDKGPFEGFKFERGEAAALEQKLKDGDINAVIVIPAGFSDAVSQGQPASVELQVDQSSQTVAPILQGVVGNIVDQTDRALTNSPQLMHMEVRSVLADSINGIDFLIPGILAMSIMQLGLFATAQPLISMRTEGVLKRLGATPLPRTILLMSYIAMRVTIAVIQTGIIVGLGVLVFNVSVVGNWFALAGWILLSTLMFISIGFFVAAISKTQEGGTALVNLINFPMLFLSGVFFPVDSMPDFLKPIIAAFPLTYTADSIRQVMIGSPPIHSQMINLLVQLAWLLAMSVLAVRFFKWDAR